MGRFYLVRLFWQSLSAQELWCCNTVVCFFLSQSRVLAVDKEEAAVDLTRENVHRYKPTYYLFLVNCYLGITRSPQYFEVCFIFITTGN